MKKNRKINMNALTNDEADKLSEQIGAKIRKKVDKTVEEVNTFLKDYGMKAVMQIALAPLETESKEQ